MEDSLVDESSDDSSGGTWFYNVFVSAVNVEMWYRISSWCCISISISSCVASTIGAASADGVAVGILIDCVLGKEVCSMSPTSIDSSWV